MGASEIKEIYKMSKWYLLLGLISVLVLISGGALAFYGAHTLLSVLNLESSRLLHEPITYVNEVKGLALSAARVFLLGAAVAFLGLILSGAFLQRRHYLLREKIWILELEARVTKLESARVKHKH